MATKPGETTNTSNPVPRNSIRKESKKSCIVCVLATYPDGIGTPVLPLKDEMATSPPEKFSDREVHSEYNKQSLNNLPP